MLVVLGGVCESGLGCGGDGGGHDWVRLLVSESPARRVEARVLNVWFQREYEYSFSQPKLL